jgi:dienelactone hydrolase
LLLSLFAACGASAPAPAPVATPPSPAVTAAPAPAPAAAPVAAPSPSAPDLPAEEAAARAFIAQLASHQFAAAVATFDDQMRAALPTDKLAAAWTQIEGAMGSLGHVDSIALEPVRDSRVAIARTSFARGSLVLKISVDPHGKISGFFIEPDAPPSPPPYEPPAYVHRDTFDDIDVTVGKLPGTLSLPKHAAKVPAVVLVHGSGPSDRDEHIGALVPFKDIAWGLASRGIAVLRYDKRTKVDPTGVRTQRDEVDEAAHAAVALLAARPEVDRARIALLGHSQGGYLAPRIARDDRAIKRLVILAGLTRPLEDAAIAQLRYLSSLHPGAAELAALVHQAEHVKEQVEDPQLAPDAVIEFLGAKLTGAYFLDVREYHPAEVAASLSIPMLVVQGAKDYQVTLADDFPAWQHALGSRPNVTLRLYPALGHAFTPGGTRPSPADYDKPGHVEALVIDDLAAFLSAPVSPPHPR